MKNNLPKLSNDKGVTAIIVALLLAVFLGIAALAVDGGYVYMAKNKIQNAADAAALAAGSQLGMICANMTVTQQQGSFDGYVSVIQQAAKAPVNTMAGVNVTIANADIVLGTWPPFSTTTTGPTAVRVTARSAVATFFARIFGKNTVDISAVATAALTPASSGTPGPPFAISEHWFDNTCTANVTKTLRWNSSSDPTSCVNWMGQNRNEVNSLIQCVYDGNCASMNIGKNVNMTNGTISNLFVPLRTLFDNMKVLNDGKKDADASNTTWTTEVAIMDFPCGSGGTYPIVGFSTITIANVDTSNMTVTVITNCNVVRSGSGGSNNNNNVLGSIPQLVQ